MKSLKIVLCMFVMIAIIPQAYTQKNVSTKSENGLTTFAFKTKNGDVTINLPSNLYAGDMFSVTVNTNPKGKNKNQLIKNNNVLKGMVFELEDKETLVEKEKLSWKIPDVVKEGITYLILKDSRGKELGKIPVPLIVKPRESFLPDKLSELDFKIPDYFRAGKTEMIPGYFDGDFSNSVIKINDVESKILAESPEGIFFKIPEDISGPVEITLKEKGFSLSEQINMINLNLSADKLSLMQGGKTSVYIEVDGLRGISNDVPLSILNLTPTNIQMDGGNYQEFKISPDEVDENGIYKTTVEVTAMRAGSFSVLVNVEPAESGFIKLISPVGEIYDGPASQPLTFEWESFGLPDKYTLTIWKLSEEFTEGMALGDKLNKEDLSELEPIFIQEGLDETFSLYQEDIGNPLVIGIYAWQVIAFVEGSSIGESEIRKVKMIPVEVEVPIQEEKIGFDDEIIKGCCEIRVKVKSGPAMNGGLDPSNEKFTIKKTELVILKAVGLDFDELRWYCKPDSDCPENGSYRKQPLAGKVEFEWEIVTTPNWKFNDERRFAYFGQTNCGPFSKSATGDRVILMTPDVEMGKKDSAIIILKIKDQNFGNDRSVKRRITVMKERKTEDEYEIEIKSKPYQLPVAPVLNITTQEGCKAEPPKWYDSDDLEAQIFSPPKVQLYDIQNTYPCNGLIRLDAWGLSDSDSVYLECSSVNCLPDDTATVYNDDVRWTWRIIEGGGQFIKGNVGQYVIYEAPSDSAEVKIEVKVDNPFDFQCVDKISEPDTVTLHIIKSGLRLNEDCIGWRYVCDSEKDTWIRDEIEVFIKNSGFSCDVCPNYGYWIDWGDSSKPETEMEAMDFKMICSHKYEKNGYFDVTVKVFNECDTLTKTFNVPIFRPECKDLVDKSLKEVNFDAKQIEDARINSRSLFSFINNLEPLFRELPEKTVKDPIHGTEAKICHVLLSLTIKGIDPYQGRRGRRHISNLVKSNTNYSIFEHLVSSGANKKKWAFYKEGKKSAKVVYIPGEKPYFELTILYESDCDCEEKDMRYRIISSLTDTEAKRMASEIKKEFSNTTVSHRDKTVNVILEIAVCCPPGKCE